MTTGILLTNPKYAHNVGGAVRAAAAFGVQDLWWTGDRISFASDKPGKERLPREERLWEYQSVNYRHTSIHQIFKDLAAADQTPVAVEFDDRAEQLPHFEHPINAVYVFGPEDGSLGRVHRMHCHRHVFIPTKHCLNLAAAVNVVLYDRMVKRG